MERSQSIYLPSQGYHLVKKKSMLAFQATKENTTTILQDLKQETVECFQDIRENCTPQTSSKDAFKSLIQSLSTWVHIPYFPAFHSPGWLLRYLVGPYNYEWLDGITADLAAGITVGLVLIPQVLS